MNVIFFHCLLKLLIIPSFFFHQTSSFEDISTTLTNSQLIEASLSSTNPQSNVSYISTSEGFAPSTISSEPDITLLNLKERLDRIRIGMNGGGPASKE